MSAVVLWSVAGYAPVWDAEHTYLEVSRRDCAVLVRALGIQPPPGEMRARWLRLRVLRALERTPARYVAARRNLGELLALCAFAGDLGVIRWR